MIDPRGGVTTTVYDALGNAVNFIEPVGNKTTMAYDALNRLTTQTDPLGHSVTFAYDAASRETSTTDRLGRRRDLSYDNDNRLTGETWVAAGGGTTNLLTFTYDNQGNQLTAANNSGTYTMSCDALDRMSTIQEPFGLTLTATYDAAGNRTLLQDSFGGVLTSVYDAASHLTSRQFGGTSQTPLRYDLTYTARDQPATATRYSDLAGTTKVGSTTYTHDPAARLTNLQHRDASGTLLANYTYTYDLASRVLTETWNSTTTTYAYDPTNQLTSDGTTAYTYDLNGNRTMAGYQTGTANELTNDGLWTYTYDNEGNLTKKSKGASAETWTFSYDNANHLTGAQQRSTDGGTLLMQATYVYDALGNRQEKDVWTQPSGTTTVSRFAYDGPNAWADLSRTNQLQTRRLYLDGIDQLFARIASGTAAWYLTDRLGSVRDIANNTTGASIDHLNYDGFGNATESQPANGDRYKWTSREYDSETGQQYNRARYYVSTTGRWATRDPLLFGSGDTNLYRYVNNDSTDHRDPDGLKKRLTWQWKPYTGINGAFRWPIRWVILPHSDNDVGGWIFQHITVRFTVTDCSRPPNKLHHVDDDGKWDYWEAWRIPPVSSIPKELFAEKKDNWWGITYNLDKIADRWYMDGMPNTHNKGMIIMTGEAYYIDNLTFGESGPPGFSKKVPPANAHAGGLFSHDGPDVKLARYNRPITDHLVRILVATWKGCNLRPREEPHTKLWLVGSLPFAAG